MNDDLKEREKISYQWMLNRIQSFKSLVVAITIAMMAYTANSIDLANNHISIILLGFSCALLLIALVIAGLDAGGSVFYNEKSQEGVSKKLRYTMYICILLSSILIFISKINNSLEKINSQTTTFTEIKKIK